MSTGVVTYQTIETKVLRDLELLDETFIQTGIGSEMMGYCNEAIHIAESHILKLCKDYFMDYQPFPITDGVSEYPLPTDIYADKIRKLIYSNGTTVYPIRRLMRLSTGPQEVAYINANTTFDYYRYLLRNPTAGGRKLVLYPPARETSGTVVTIWYIRQALKVTAVTDVVDILEFHSFIEKYMKVQCLAKEGHPRLEEAKAALMEEQDLMISTLENREPDDDDELEQDLSFYREHT